jgi:hypothetical protein
MDWKETIKDSYKEKYQTGIEIYKNNHVKAIEYANEHSCIGEIAKQEALAELAELKKGLK